MNRKIYNFASSIPLIVKIKQMYDWLEFKVFSLKKSLRKFLRGNSVFPKKKLSVGILCIKRTVYAQMAINNANSLHYLSLAYPVVIYCDELCKKYFESHWQEFDYPQLVTLVSIAGSEIEYWQIYKIKALEEITKRGGALVDADSRWFSEPIIDLNKVCFLTRVNYFHERILEKEFLEEELTTSEMRSFWHFATGFIYIPKEIGSESFFVELHRMCDRLKKISLTKQFISMQRLVDEISICICIQREVNLQRIKVLKLSDGPWDNSILKSFYFGTLNKIYE